MVSRDVAVPSRIVVYLGEKDAIFPEDDEEEEDDDYDEDFDYKEKREFVLMVCDGVGVVWYDMVWWGVV